MIFHLTSEAEWKKAQSVGQYVAESLTTEGFIHLSSYGQILQVANLFYKNVSKPVLLALDNTNLGAELKWEGFEGLDFPHLYRPIKISEVVSVVPLNKNQAGEYVSSTDLDTLARAKTLVTERLIIREFQSSDQEFVHSYASDEDLVKYMPWGPNNVRQTREFLTRNFKFQSEVPRKTYDFAVINKLNGEFLGSGGLILTAPHSEFAHVGYIFKRSAHGKGYATEVTQALIKFGFEELKLNRVAATCDHDNKASFRVMEKSGMKQEGLLRENMRAKGKLRSTLVYSILKNEYLKQ
jgi:[ribosomal protein S5]-alanine N-acetyltransferase